MKLKCSVCGKQIFTSMIRQCKRCIQTNRGL